MPAVESDADLAARLTAYVVLAHDPAVPGVAADYWELSTKSYAGVDDAVAAFVTEHAPSAAKSYREILAAPTDTAPQVALRQQLQEALAAAPVDAASLREAVTAADGRIWIDYHLGEAVDASAGPAESGTGTGPDVHVVIPFRDRAKGLRTRNLLACLQALRDQDCDASVEVTVVEADREPGVRDLIESWVDRYLFVHKDGLFNKSWTVNVGVAGAARNAPAVCVLDADILVDRAFVTRNLDRLRNGSHGTHLPFRWSLSLDEPSTRRAIAARVRAGRPDVPDAALRGLLLREAPGGCVWIRSEVFHAVGGFDERYEGWGGEDDDVIARLDRAAGVARFDDHLLHLNHPRPDMTRDGTTPFNAHLKPMSWTADHGYGDPERFVTQAAAPGAQAS